jgi:hypothetical protein
MRLAFSTLACPAWSLAQIFEAAPRYGYDAGWLSVEWEKKWHPELAEPEIALPQHSAKLREYLAVL